MKKWKTMLALLLAMVFCFPITLVEAEAADGAQPVSYVPGELAGELLTNALASGKVLTARIRGEGIPLEAEMPDLILRLGAGATQQGVRVELGLRESQQNMGFDAILDATAQGIAIESDLLPGERYTMGWKALLGMDLSEMGELSGALETQLAQASTALSALEPLLEPYVATINGFMQELTVQEYYDVPEENGVAPMAYEAYILCTHAQAGELLTRLAKQLEDDIQMTAMFNAMLASEGLGAADVVEMMRSAAEPLAQSEGHCVLGMGTNHDMAAKPWFFTFSNTQADGASDSFYLGFEPGDENNDLHFNLAYLQTLADESKGIGVDVMVSIFPDAMDARATDWGARLTATKGDTKTGKLGIGVNNEAITTEDGLPGYETSVYIGVGAPEITMEYAHGMKRYRTADGGEALLLEATLCPDTSRKAETYGVALEAGIAPGADGLRGEGSLMIGTVDIPGQTGLGFELYEAEPMRFGGESKVVALDALSEKELNELGERLMTALEQCLDAMPVQQEGK